MIKKLFAAVLVVAMLGIFPLAPRADAALARVNGSGSAYVALALQQWVAEGQTQGLEINYLPTGSPQGLTSYGQSLVDFAATEAEFSALQASGGETVRGFQYVPDVAGATAVLYNVQDKAGRKVDYLHLSGRTLAAIFTGSISRWSDPAITADNQGFELPDQPITVVYRAGQSGTTGMFYDYIANVAPDLFNPWANRWQLPTGNVRIIQLDSAPGFAPKTLAFNGSDQIAQHIASNNGTWSIGYDEFGYALTYGASAAWIQNASGSWVLPYAENISAALEGAKLRPDLSQELSGVYGNTNPLAYPISSYSYLVTQCPQVADRPTCKGAYANTGVTETMAKWMRYIACDGQINMARIGYSPLPPNLSQELVNSIARMEGSGAPEVLTPANCANPRFHGSLGEGAGSPADPFVGAVPGFGQGAAGASASGAADEVAAAGVDEAASQGAATAAGGGTGEWQPVAPVAYVGPRMPATGMLPLGLLAVIVAVPAGVGWRIQKRRRSSAG